MKRPTIFHPALGRIILHLLVLGLVLSIQPARAMEGGTPEPSGSYSREELAQMLAPIALYPDALLSQVLMASTYPIEVIEADRWVKRNPGLKDKTLDEALLEKEWDPSVKAICHFPTVIALMSERISETTEIGNAFLAQEDAVMETVQDLRARAHAEGNLTTTAQQRVVLEKETIIIQPVNPRVIYVPYYDPFYVYGPWWYPAYPPWYWGPARVSLGFGISYWPGIYFSFSFGNWSYFDWHRHSIYLVVHERPRFVRHDHWYVKSGPWQHTPIHRRGVVYRDSFTATKYGQPLHHSREIRRDSREFQDHRHRGPDRRDHGRIVIDGERREGDRSGIDRGRHERERVERARRVPEQLDRSRRGEQRLERGLQERQRQERQWAEHDRQMRRGTDRQMRPQERIEREQPQGSRDNIHRGEDIRRDPRTIDRGRFSRRGPSDGSKGQGHWRAGDQGGRHHQDRTGGEPKNKP